MRSSVPRQPRLAAPLRKLFCSELLAQRVFNGAEPLSLWHLTDAQQMTLLGLSNEKTLYNWKNQPEKAMLTRDPLERASYILSIYRDLQTLLPDQMLADQWLSTPNDNPLFNGTAPLDRLLAGQVVDLAVVLDFLNAELSGW